MLSAEVWARQLKEKSLPQQANHILGNLIGYRSTSAHRAEDLESLANAIIAVKILVQEENTSQKLNEVK